MAGAISKTGCTQLPSPAGHLSRGDFFPQIPQFSNFLALQLESHRIRYSREVIKTKKVFIQVRNGEGWELKLESFH